MFFLDTASGITQLQQDMQDCFDRFVKKFQYRKRYYPVATKVFGGKDKLLSVSIPQAVLPSCNLSTTEKGLAEATLVSIPQAVLPSCNLKTLI